jgi:hypothetical protein
MSPARETVPVFASYEYDIVAEPTPCEDPAPRWTQGTFETAAHEHPAPVIRLNDPKLAALPAGIEAGVVVYVHEADSKNALIKPVFS